MKGRILITGADGFIGAQLVRCLEAKRPAPPLILVDVHPVTPHPGILRCNLSDRSAVDRLIRRYRPSTIFHCAGRSRGTPHELIEANARTTLNLLSSVHRHALRTRTVLLASAAEYGAARRTRADFLTLQPESAYAWSKCCQTLIGLQAIAFGQDVVIARLFNPIGPRMPRTYALGSFAHQIARAERLNRRAIEVGSLTPRRDFLDVRDVARALVCLANHGATGNIYEVCSGQAHSIRSALKFLIGLSSARIHTKRSRNRVRTHDIPYSVGNPQALQRLGWKPQISLRQSLTDLLDSHRLNAD